MAQVLIREDEDGLYANVGGWKVRPFVGSTNKRLPNTTLKAGDHATASHSGGPWARVGGIHWWIERESDATIATRKKQ